MPPPMLFFTAITMPPPLPMPWLPLHATPLRLRRHEH